MLVATRPRAEFDNPNDFVLYVYDPALRQVAKADSKWSVGEHAVWVENPTDGVYTIVVVLRTMIDPPAIYDGFISFDRGLTVKRQQLKDGVRYTHSFVAFGLPSAPSPPIELWPDLVPTKPRDFQIASAGLCLPANFTVCLGEAQQPSCYAEETAGVNTHPPGLGPHPLRCLRFSQGETNVGDGPFELHMYPTEDNQVAQRIYRSDGTVREPVIGEAFFHPGHGHFHYTGDTGEACVEARECGWWGISLHKRLPNGKPGDIVSQALYRAKGICPLDLINRGFGQRGASGPQAYNDSDYPDYNTCQTPRHVDPNPDAAFPLVPYIQAGVSVRWTDIYPWFVMDQYIDITDVPDGTYVIVTKQDPGGFLIEKSTKNNTAMACVEISGLTARAC